MFIRCKSKAKVLYSKINIKGSAYNSKKYILYNDKMLILESFYMITKVKDINFEEEVLLTDKTVVIKLYTSNCSKCSKINPIFQNVANKNNENFKFCEWEVLKKTNILSRYKLMAVPTLLFFKNGKLIHRKVGVQSEKNILNYLHKVEKLNDADVLKKELKGIINWSFLKFWL